MVAEIGASPDLYKPSRFWDDLNPVNTGWLNEFGLDNFKRTVSQNYFNWLIVSHRDVQFRAAAREWLRRPTLRPLLTRMESPELLRTVIGLENAFGKRAQLTYCLFVAMLWDVTSRHDPLGLTKKLEEPTLGTPLGIVSAGRRVSQDLANSIREYNAIAHWSVGRAGKRTTIAELGAGYGRLAHVALTNRNNRYFVFRLPPALFVSQWYLSRLFPDRKVFSFRHFRILRVSRGRAGGIGHRIRNAQSDGSVPRTIFRRFCQHQHASRNVTRPNFQLSNVDRTADDRNGLPQTVATMDKRKGQIRL